MSAVVSAVDYAAESIRSELLAINEAHGVVTPPLVVDRARDPASPLHGYFEWDREQAAEKFLLIQAAALIRRVKLTVIRASTESKVVTVRAVRGIVSPVNERRSKSNPTGGYSPIEAVLADPARRSALLSTAHRELAAVRKKFEALDELASVWAAIDELTP